MGCSVCGKRTLVGKARTIVNGVTHYFEDKNDQLYKERMQFCSKCPRRTFHGQFCGECKCLLQAKLRLEEERCPLDKWQPIEKAV
jgi:hypothetical protein